MKGALSKWHLSLVSTPFLRRLNAIEATLKCHLNKSPFAYSENEINEG
jgi:hypothetical protein